jgi:uncharacterized MAPEG superfamily protein
MPDVVLELAGTKAAKMWGPHRWNNEPNDWFLEQKSASKKADRH